jgi:hypothetical protein
MTAPLLNHLDVVQRVSEMRLIQIPRYQSTVTQRPISVPRDGAPLWCCTEPENQIEVTISIANGESHSAVTIYLRGAGKFLHTVLIPAQSHDRTNERAYCIRPLRLTASREGSK